MIWPLPSVTLRFALERLGVVLAGAMVGLVLLTITGAGLHALAVGVLR